MNDKEIVAQAALDYVKNILFHKKKHTSKNIEDLKTYNPFMVNRWASMFDGESANIINQTTNKVNYFNNDKDMHYKMLLNRYETELNENKESLIENKKLSLFLCRDILMRVFSSLYLHALSIRLVKISINLFLSPNIL